MRSAIGLYERALAAVPTRHADDPSPDTLCAADDRRVKLDLDTNNSHRTPDDLLDRRLRYEEHMMAYCVKSSAHKLQKSTIKVCPPHVVKHTRSAF
jgi:hypothetical protein